MWLVRWRPDISVDVARGTAHALFGLINSTPRTQRLARHQLEPLLRTMALAAADHSAAPDAGATEDARSG